VPLALYGEILDQAGRLRPKYSSSRLRVVPLNNLKFLAFRMGAAPWGTDVTLRRKVNDAIDRESMVDSLFRGQARVARSIVPQWEGKASQSESPR
jgi:ABC-type transport system substrate-binding protein